jgi:hypothetical protein
MGHTGSLSGAPFQETPIEKVRDYWNQCPRNTGRCFELGPECVLSGARAAFGGPAPSP